MSSDLEEDNVEITVSGRAERRVPPELAVVTLRVGFEAERPEPAVRQTTELANALGSALRALRDAAPSPVRETALLPLSTSSWRPWSNDGRQLPLRHRAESRARLTFTDFAALPAFMDRWGREPGIQVDGVEWRLTRGTEDRVTAEVLAEAVRDARARAEALAAAAGEGRVSFVALSDSPLTPAEPPQPRFARAAMMDSAGGGGEGIDLTPEDIEIAAVVHARFTTD